MRGYSYLGAWVMIGVLSACGSDQEPPEQNSSSAQQTSSSAPVVSSSAAVSSVSTAPSSSASQSSATPPTVTPIDGWGNNLTLTGPGAGADGSSKAGSTSYNDVRDGDLNTYWEATGTSNERISVKWSTAQSFNTVVLRELGNNITSWQLQNHQTGAILTSGTNIGTELVVNLGTVSMTKLNLIILSANARPRISEFEVYHANIPTSSASSSVSSSSASSTGNNAGGETSACLSNPMGFASLGSGTTGGAGGEVITVRTGTEFSAALKAHEDAWKNDNSHRTIIRIDGTINAGNSSVSRFDLKDADNVSIIGVGNRGVLDGRGILLRGASNVIIRNLTIRYVRDGSGDGIELDGTRPIRNVWIDHNTFYNSLAVDKDYYDGLIDGKNDIDNITISYNIMRDSWKTSLWGQSDSNDFDRRITFAYNHIEDVNSRVPLLRFGQTHIYNNYYNNIIDTGINTRMGNRVLIENNVFENSKNPIVSCYSSQIGYWDTRDNIFNNVNWQNANDCVVAGPNVGSTVTYTPPYSAQVMPASQVKQHVLSNAGAGRCNP